MDNGTLSKNISICGLPDDTTTTYDPACFPGSQEEALLKTLHWVSSSVLGTIFVITGITGNILSLVIWRRSSLWSSSTGRYLNFLSLADIIVLVLYFLLEIMPCMRYPNFRLVATVSLWLTVCVTTDRYIQVCCPLKVTHWSTKRRVHLITALVLFLSILVNIPSYLIYVPERKSVNSFRISALGQSDAIQTFDFWLYCIFLMHLACFILVFMNFKMIRRLKTIILTRPQSELTRMILFLSFASLLQVAMQCSSQCYLMIFQTTCEAIFKGAWSLTLLAIVIRSSVNIVFYTVFCGQFRTELKHMFQWRNENEAGEGVTPQEESDN